MDIPVYVASLNFPRHLKLKAIVSFTGILEQKKKM